MSVIVNDDGFSDDTWTRGFTPLADLPANDTPCCIDLPSDADPALLSNRLTKIDMIRVDFPSSADGRGFTIARRLRLMGFDGRLRARGHVIADQYAMARRSGFDEVEIGNDLAERQPEPQWLARANWQDHNYQSRLRRAAI
jgi:uncharacterized protein (DUF934 family)